jgi:hypothetical protein
VDLEPGQRLVTLRIHITRLAEAEVRLLKRKSRASRPRRGRLRHAAKNTHLGAAKGRDARMVGGFPFNGSPHGQLLAIARLPLASAFDWRNGEWP